MPTLPWTTPETPDPDGKAVVMASRLEVRSLRHVPGFFLASMALLRQARRSPGALGLALRAEPLRRTFWTVSAWTDREAVNAYASAEPHRSSMRAKRKVMRESVFVFWSVPASDLPIGWDEVERRIAEKRGEIAGEAGDQPSR
ncbi:DUF3291 domain-containing protein [Actinomadura logoneensis]|uniref:DUF3291 domain-containing protein n=1 Tax=Actinomadura logoneensis TaxID=2293572 RepID=A0A372JAK8_9ACTN|nr:DUF3291 domain-containing protein [Actinomadura logoneensis]RFU36856.1 DUF3291 domain-containing protein [Actinomadura logoneensis]